MTAQAREELRERIAIAALQGLIIHDFKGNENNGFSLVDPAYAAKESVEYADALLVALAKVGAR